ncbi:protein PHOX1 [Canna indica]|uniref:Protein PHOX1 n=1 Tax=Canna indica TaxID=4628 RepID=A0AAQ3K0V0_9LILI|nr:protein PHOX1 [Canna indica]
MGKPTGKKSRSSASKLNRTNSKHGRSSEHNPKVFDQDTTIFMDMAKDMKEEGSKLFQKRDYVGALYIYEKAVKLLPKNHIDTAHLHSNMAACYMLMAPEDYHGAIMECNLALEASPKYSKALLKRARCFEALNRLDLAYKDAKFVLTLEPNNLTALEISERVKKAMEKKGITLDEDVILSLPDVVVVKEKPKKNKKKRNKAQEKMITEIEQIVKEEPMKAVKLVFGDDIRWAQIPANCSILHLRETVGKKFPNLKAILIKYKDKEGDLVTITTSEELRWAEESADPQGSIRLFLTEVSPEHEPWFEDAESNSSMRGYGRKNNNISENGSIKNDEEKNLSSYVDDWILQFAELFKNQLGFSSDGYLNLHELGMKLYYEAIEDTVTSEEAQEIFKLAEGKFQEMVALALFNWGNVHMSRARKKLFLSEDASKESILEKVKDAYKWAQTEYTKAGERYEEALKIKPDFYEGHFALGQQLFEQARLSWYYAVGSNIDLDAWPSEEVIGLFNGAEDSMEKGMEMWEKMEKQHLEELSKSLGEKSLLEKMGLNGYFKELTVDETTDQASKMRSQINILWGSMLYERSVVEFKIGLPTWEECLMSAVDKFKHAGVSEADITVTIKNHCANSTSQEGLAFKIDEIVQAWNEMSDAKSWMGGVPSYRLEPLFRRKVPKLHQVLESV